MSTQTLKPFFTYFGGKYRAAPRYPEPLYSRIIEPFAGAAGYSMRYPERDIQLVDLNPVVIGTWDYLITAPESEILCLPVYDGDWETIEDLDHLPQEARWLIGWWLNKGTTAPGKTPSAWMRDPSAGGTHDFWGEGIKARIASQQKFIRHWTATVGTYADLAPSRSTWFIDPPYQVAGKRYTHSRVDYPHLADWCRTREGQVIVCENQGADWMDFSPFLDIKATHRRGRTGVSKEVIWHSHEHI